MMRVLLYTRVSTTDQAEEGTSLGSQLDACRHYAAERDYQIVGEYADTWTGSQYRERPGLSELRRHVRDGIADVVLCYALDRLSRDQMHVAVLIDEIEHNGARLELVTEQFDDTPTGRLIRSVQSFVAEIEREKIVERTVRGKIARIKSGRLLPGGRQLYGLRLNADHDAYLVNPETAPVVQRIYREYVNGEPLRGLQRSLFADQIPPPTGPLRPWALSTLRRVLANPRYKGEARAWNGEMELPPGTIPALVDVETWERAQVRLATARERSRRNNQNPEVALLRGGIGKCGLCGANLIVLPRTSRTAWDYHCSYRSNGCKKFSMTTHGLDAAVMEHLRRLFVDEGRIQIEAERALRNSGDGERRAIHNRRAALERQQTALSDAIALASDPDAITTLVSRLETVSSQLRAISDEQRAINIAAGLAEQRRRDLRDLLAKREVVAANFESLNYRERRDLLDGLKITVYLWPSSRRPRWEIRSPLFRDIVFT